MKTTRGTRRALQWLSERAQKNRLQGCIATLTLDQLEDSHRPLLFSLLPRMLRGDGTTPGPLRSVFAHLDRRGDRASAMIVSSRRWSRALAKSRMLRDAHRRSAGDPQKR